VAKRQTDALVIAIDGPSGSGKSTVARGVARRLELRYLDTGAMYRALTWLVLERGIDITDAPAIAGLAATAELTVVTSPDRPSVAVDGTDVTTEIRSSAVTAAVSAVSAVPEVRAVMVRRQREEIGAGGIVVEGRDIGSTVAPNAPIKVFLTAASDVRAARRDREIAGSDADSLTLSATEDAMRRRDAADSSRAASPLTQAPDALVVDSSAMSAEDVIDLVVAAAAEVVHA